MKRILIIGDKEVGKTTFMNIFLNKQTTLQYEPTIGVEAGAKTIEFEDRSFVNLQVWDTPGQEEYSEMAFPFYSNCKLFVLILDRIRVDTLESLPTWLQSTPLFIVEIEQNNPSKVNTVLIILNKIPKSHHSGNKEQQFSKQTLQTTYQKQLQSFHRKKFEISIIQVDIMEERQQLNRNYLHPYLHDCLFEEIITETEEKKLDKWGGVDCKNEGCEIM